MAILPGALAELWQIMEMLNRYCLAFPVLSSSARYWACDYAAGNDEGALSRNRRFKNYRRRTVYLTATHTD